MERFGLERLLVLVAAAPGHKEVDAPTPRRGSSSRGPRSRTTTVELDDARAAPSTLLRGERLRRPDLPDRRRRVRDFPDWKEPERRARAGAARRRHAPRLPARRARARSTGSTARARRDLRDRAACRSPRARSATALRAGRADGRARARRRVAELIRERGLYRRRPATLSANSRRTTETLTSLEQARRIAALAQEKLARDVVILDMRPGVRLHRLTS